MQDGFFQHYLEKYVKPTAEKLATSFGVSESSVPLIEMLYHFRGEGGAKVYLDALKSSGGNAQYAQQQLDLKYPSENNMPVEKYLEFYK